MYAQVRIAQRVPRALAQRRLLNTSSPVRNVPPPPPPPTAAGAAAGTINPPPKQKSIVGRLIAYTIIGGLVFYPASAYISTQNESYREFFINVPGGEALADYADDNGWDHFGPGTIVQSLASLRSTSKEDVQAKISEAKRSAEAKASEFTTRAKSASEDAQKRLHDATEAAKVRAAELQKQASKKAAELRDSTAAAAADAKAKAIHAKDEVAAAGRDAAAAMAGTADAVVKDTKEAVDVAKKAAGDAAAKASDDVQSAVAVNPYVDTQKPRPLLPETVVPQRPTYEGQEKYGEEMPLGFEPPPGYYIPPPPPKPKTPEPEKLPLLAPKVKEFGTDEPIISQLASTIDSLTSSLSMAKGGASAESANILARAQNDLSSLNARLDDVKKTEQQRLQTTVEAKTREFEAQLKQKEAAWQQDEAGLKQTWEAERQKMIDGWRDVLNVELETQRESIEQRLREEVVSQGIELQRRWLRSIKSQVETERGGRLAKLEALTTSLKHLERITLDNSAVLDDNVRLHKIWSALRAVQSKAERGNMAFDDELRVLQALSTPADPDTGSAEDSVMAAALAQLEASGIPQTGVKSFSSLASWFTNSVAPRIHETSLVPAPEEATVASHLASMVLSKILFRPKAGLVAGEDVGAVLARAEWALGEKDLDAAAREVNQLRGWPRKLAEDWLREARRKLAVQQALDVVGTEATLSSLLMV